MLSKLASLAVILQLVAVCAATIRGVDPKDASLYAGTNFQCQDGSKTIALDLVNDDFCDCPDGSDEPGTSACNGNTFKCINKGHKVIMIPSSRVDDTICDCCDGSDEAAGACSDYCEQEGAETKAALILKIETIEQGLKIQAELALAGPTNLAKKREEKKGLETELVEMKEALEIATAEKERIEAEEKAERARLQEEWDAEHPVVEEAEVPVVEEAEVPVVEEEEAELRLVELEAEMQASTDQLAEQVIGEVAPAEEENFPYPAEYAYQADAEESAEESEGECDMEGGCGTEVEEAADAAADSTAFPYPAEYAAPAQEDEVVKEDEDANAFPYPAEYAAPPQEPEIGEEGSAFPYPAEYAAPPVEGVPVPSTGGLSEPEEVVEEVATGPRHYDHPDMKSAKSEFNSKRSDVSSVESEIHDLEELLDHDFGDNEEFAYLLDQCFDINVKQYTYQFCPYDQAAQKEKSSSTSLGHFSKWSDDYSSMWFEHGQKCWNGPSRSAEIKLQCGLENKVTDVQEPSKCVYLFTFVTPSACKEEDIIPLRAELKAMDGESA